MRVPVGAGSPDDHHPTLRSSSRYPGTETWEEGTKSEPQRRPPFPASAVYRTLTRVPSKFGSHIICGGARSACHDAPTISPR
jgi:hypothetical protein